MALHELNRGGGWRTTVAGTAPAAGADAAAFVVPAGEHWELRGVRYSLVSSSAVASRSLTLIVDDGTNVIAKIPVLAPQAASLTVGYSFVADLGYANSAAVNGELVTGIPLLLLAPGYRLSVVTASIQTADQHAAPVISYVKRTS